MDNSLAEVSVLSTGYKPNLKVDVSTTDVKDDEPISSFSSAKAQTPHVSTNIFVAGLPSTWGDAELREQFQVYGEIVSTKVVKNRHFGFVMFRRPESAHAAINTAHLTRPSPNSPTVIHVSIAMHDEGVNDAPNSRIFVRGLPQWATKEHMRHCFSVFGKILDCAVLMNPLGQCKGSGFVQFETTEEATMAVDSQEAIKIDNWDGSLEVKYSESLEVRQQRQERNRRRQKNWGGFSKYKNGNAAVPIKSPFPFYQPALPMIPSPQGFPMIGHVPFPLVYPQPSPVHANSPHPTQIIYPQPIVHSGFFQPPAVIVVDTPPLPQKGDLHCSGMQSEELLQTLLHPYGPVAEIKVLDPNSIAVRMKDQLQHPLIAQQLNGTIFSTGQVLSVGLYA